MAFKMKPKSPLLKSTMLYSDGGTNESPKQEKKDLNKYNVIDDIASPNKQIGEKVKNAVKDMALNAVTGGIYGAAKSVKSLISKNAGSARTGFSKKVEPIEKQSIPEGKKVNVHGELYDVKKSAKATEAEPLKRVEKSPNKKMDPGNGDPISDKKTESAGDKLKKEVGESKTKLKKEKAELKKQKKITKLQNKKAKIEARTKKKKEIKENLEKGLRRSGKPKATKYDENVDGSGTKVGNFIRKNIKLKKGSNDGKGTKVGNAVRKGKEVVKDVVKKVVNVIPKRKERTGEGYKQTDYVGSKRIGEQRQTVDNTDKDPKSPATKSPAKQIGVDKKDTKAFEKTKKLEARGDSRILKYEGRRKRLEEKKLKVGNRINKKAERKAKRILKDKYLSSPAKSFKGLVSKLEKQGKSKEAATKIAGKVANAKLKGAGSGPTAKQKARMKK